MISWGWGLVGVNLVCQIHSQSGMRVHKGEAYRHLQRHERGAGDAGDHAGHVVVVAVEGTLSAGLDSFGADQQNALAQEKREQEVDGGVIAFRFVGLCIHEFLRFTLRELAPSDE